MKDDTSFYTLIKQSDLVDSFPDICKLLEIILATPVSSSEAERCISTLKRIKTFLRNTMGQDRLNALAVLSAHKDFIRKCADFNKRVITSLLPSSTG